MKNSIKDFIKPKSKFLKNKTVRLAKQLLYVSFTVLLLSSCSGGDSDSDNTTSDYYFKATLDGRKINFHTANFQGGGNDDRFEQIVLGGFETPYPTTGGIAPPSLDFEIWKLGGNITAGTYSTPAEEGMIARYAVQTSNGTIIYNTSNADDIFTVKIEAISKSGIKGTFSGKVRNLDSGKAIEITEGSFNLPYKDIVNP